jgi:hypothetical protein
VVARGCAATDGAGLAITLSGGERIAVERPAPEVLMALGDRSVGCDRCCDDDRDSTLPPPRLRHRARAPCHSPDARPGALAPHPAVTSTEGGGVQEGAAR